MDNENFSDIPILSICICSLYRRAHLLHPLVTELVKQIREINAENKVEIITRVDHGKIPTGIKRNELYNEAKGIYVSSVDDDDEVFPYYVKEIIKAAETLPDAIAMNGLMTWDGMRKQRWWISKDLPYTAHSDGLGNVAYLRFHNHLSPIKKSIAIKYPFPPKFMEEDYAFALALHSSGDIKTEVVIGTPWNEFWQTKKCLLPMYHYKFITKKTI